MGDSDASSSLSTLVSQEKLFSIEAENEVGIPDLEGSEDDYIRLLVQKESLSPSQRVSDAASPDWLKSERLNAITWILKTRAQLGLKHKTAYLSVAYIDHYLSRKSIHNGPSWIIKLLSIACLWLAAKMEEGGVAGLKDYLVKDAWTDKEAIQRMELLVLSALEWKIRIITPFAYTNYLMTKLCGKTEPTALIPKVKELLLGVIRETNLIDRRPSIIAAAAVLAANDTVLTPETLEFKINGISLWGDEELEHIFSFYHMMTGKLNTPKPIISPNEAPDPPTVFGLGTKRRLAFGDHEAEDCSLD
ncbi:hypothetical protein Ancab_025906 [Ancistrocladus abbreviatus]